jgi:disulfide bond formation protein DsbB
MFRDLFKITPTRLFVWIMLIGIAVFASAYVMENYFGVLSCKLCVYERLVFAVGGGIAFVSLIILTPRLQSMAVSLIGITFLFGGCLALYHVAIQQHLVDLPTFCNTMDFGAMNNVQALKEALLQTPFVRCDQVNWSFMGLSLAAYNAILSFFLTFVCWGWVKFHTVDVIN